jgi:hypothetical protein
MRFGKCTWSAHDGEFKNNIILVEDAYDRSKPEPLVGWNYPEALRTREMAARTSALVTELLRVLEARGALNADEVRQLSASAERHSQELKPEFYRMDNIDSGV